MLDNTPDTARGKPLNWFVTDSQLAKHLRPLAAAAVLIPLAATPALSQTAAPDWADRHIAAGAIPMELQTAVDEMLEAANNRDLDQVLSQYDADFEHGDGLNLDEISAAISNFWEVHPDLDYRASIQSWAEVADGYEATIVTDVTGIQTSERGDFDLVATSTVLNTFEINDEGDLLLVGQEVLEESSQLVSGEDPPEVTVNMPTKVSVGSEFDVEAIVEEPLGETLLLGAAIEEPINPESYLESPPLPLQPLQAGGLFRRADAPDRPGAEWISVMLVSDGGIFIEGRRLNFVIGPTEY